MESPGMGRRVAHLSHWKVNRTGARYEARMVPEGPVDGKLLNIRGKRRFLLKTFNRILAEDSSD